MFTGLVEEIGRVTAVEPSGDGIRLTIHAPRSVADAAHGDSIAVSGVCLTVVARDGDGFTADVMRQTLAATLPSIGSSTSNGQPPRAGGWAGTSCRAMSTARAPSSTCGPATSGA